MNKIKLFTAFSGIGCQEMALKNINLDFEIVGTSEIDSNAIISYDIIHNKNEYVKEKTKEEMLFELKNKNISFNFKKNIKYIKKLYDACIRNKNYGDISKINEKNLLDIDLFTYSFPCQDISSLGKRKGFKKENKTRSSLLWDCEKIIKYKKPKYLLMENVKNLISKKFKDDFLLWEYKLKQIGYNSYYKVLNACNFGVPQNRERIIMISILKEFDNGFIFPKNLKLKKNLYDILEKKNKNIINMYNKYNYNIKKLNVEKLLNENCFFKKNIKNNENFICGRLVSFNKDNKDNNEIKQILELRKDDISGCITTSQKDNVIIIKNILSNKIKIRKLSPLECWRLMGYSDKDFFKVKNCNISNTQLYKQAGNGIVIFMLEEIFKNLFNYKKNSQSYFKKKFI